MTPPMHGLLQLTFRNMSPSELWAACVRGELERLERFRDHLTACHVVLERALEDQDALGLGTYLLRFEVRTLEGLMVLLRKTDGTSSEGHLCDLAREAFASLAQRLGGSSPGLCA